MLLHFPHLHIIIFPQFGQGKFTLLSPGIIGLWHQLQIGRTTLLIAFSQRKLIYILVSLLNQNILLWFALLSGIFLHSKLGLERKISYSLNLKKE